MRSAMTGRRLAKWAGSAGTLLITLAAVLIGLTLATGTADAKELGAVDIVNSASCSITGVKTTLNSATIYWSERRSNHTMQFCYGIGNLNTCTTNVPDRGSSNIWNMTGLAANTKYMVKFYGTDGSKHYQATGTVITDGTTYGGVPLSYQVTGFILTPQGDSLGGVNVVATSTASGTVVAKDSSDVDGGFVISVTAGTYVLKFTYQNYPSVSYTVTVGKTDVAIPDQIIKVPAIFVMPKRDPAKIAGKADGRGRVFDLRGARLGRSASAGYFIFRP